MPRVSSWADRFAQADWATIAQTFLSGLQGAASHAGKAQATVEIVQQVTQWQMHLSKGAAEKWTRYAANRVPCGFRAKPGENCGLHALARCDVCGDPCCLAHARIDYVGNAICFRCVREAMRNKGPVVAESVTDALKLFKLKKSALWEQVALAYRRAAMRWHPDRAENNKDRIRREARMKEINGAFEVLKKHYEQKEAA